MITANDVANHKPQTEPINKALSLLGGHRHTSIRISDTENDIMAAAGVGDVFCAFYPEHRRRLFGLEKLKSYNPTYVINNLRDLQDIIG